MMFVCLCGMMFCMCYCVCVDDWMCVDVVWVWVWRLIEFSRREVNVAARRETRVLWKCVMKCVCWVNVMLWLYGVVLGVRWLKMRMWCDVWLCIVVFGGSESRAFRRARVIARLLLNLLMLKFKICMWVNLMVCDDWLLWCDVCVFMFCVMWRFKVRFARIATTRSGSALILIWDILWWCLNFSYWCWCWCCCYCLLCFCILWVLVIFFELNWIVRRGFGVTRVSFSFEIFLILESVLVFMSICEWVFECMLWVLWCCLRWCNMCGICCRVWWMLFLNVNYCRYL